MLTASEISTLIDECQLSERIALNNGDLAEASWWERLWFIYIFEMQNREI